MTDLGRQTHLSPEQSQGLFQKWSKLFPKRRKAKVSEPETISEKVAVANGESSSDYSVEVLELMQALPSAGFEQLCQAILREAGFNEVVVTGAQTIKGSTVTESTKLIR